MLIVIPLTEYKPNDSYPLLLEEVKKERERIQQALESRKIQAEDFPTIFAFQTLCEKHREYLSLFLTNNPKLNKIPSLLNVFEFFG